MAFAYQVICDCGYQSEIVPYGMLSRKPFEFAVPIFIPEEGKLLSYKFGENEFNLAGGELVEWIDQDGDEFIKKKYGEAAITPGSKSGDSSGLLCPSCGKQAARFKGVGF